MMDLTGDKYGSLTVLEEAPKRRTSGGSRRYWKCVCDCGEVVEVYHSNLRGGLVLTCGCSRGLLPKEVSQGPEYGSWWNMKNRCDNPSCKDYKNYGGRGITYDESWKDFLQFLSDMGPLPNPELTLERIDNDGNYCKKNCEWATRAEQNNNSRNTKRLRAKR
jgi:hypothetical protein